MVTHFGLNFILTKCLTKPFEPTWKTLTPIKRKKNEREEMIIYRIRYMCVCERACVHITSVLPGMIGFPAYSSPRMQPALHKSTAIP